MEERIIKSDIFIFSKKYSCTLNNEHNKYLWVRIWYISFIYIYLTSDTFSYKLKTIRVSDVCFSIYVNEVGIIYHTFKRIINLKLLLVLWLMMILKFDNLVLLLNLYNLKSSKKIPIIIKLRHYQL